MKDEEMAEEWVKQEYPTLQINAVAQRYIKSFLAGLKAGRRDEQLTKAIELLKWALHSDPEHDDLADFDTKWKEAEQFIKEVEQ